MSDPIEEAGAEVYINFDFAIMAIFATYIFEISSQIGETRKIMESSKYWSKNQARLNEGMKGVRRASKQATGSSLFIIIVTAIGISLPSRALDDRMVLILEGCSLLFAAVVMGMLSFDIGRWTGLYFMVWHASDVEAPHSLAEVKFNVRWSYYRIFGRYFFFLMPFYQGTNALTIPLSMIAGIAFGIAISLVVYLARRKEEKWFRIFVVILISVIVVFSSIICGDGVYFIALIWQTIDDPDESAWGVSSFAICLSVEALCHVARWAISRKKKKSMHPDLCASASSENRPRMPASLIIEAVKKSHHHAAKIKESSRMGSVNEGSESRNEPETGTIDFAIRPIQDDDSSGPAVPVNADGDVNADIKAATDALCSSSSSESESLERDTGREVPIESESESTEGSYNTNQDDDLDGAYETPTYRQIFCAYWTCCGCVRKEDESRSEKIWSMLHWSVWWVLVVFSLYLVIVNLGSTTQQENAREKLPYVAEVLYDTMDEGPVCAFDNKGEESNITTFEDREAAHASGFLVLHCGACGACSDWDNLRQEYVTRDSLAADSAACAKKSLFGGREAVLECLKQPPISFQGKCAECWVDDILCTKGFCAFIYMQSLMINTISNFQVQEDTITSASCEEAHCEAGNPGDFVYCSGATRRRMNVTSTIQRPGAQQCGIVDVDWATLFPE